VVLSLGSGDGSLNACWVYITREKYSEVDQAGNKLVSMHDYKKEEAGSHTSLDWQIQKMARPRTKQ
jgi:hypothetical protein